MPQKSAYLKELGKTFLDSQVTHDMRGTLSLEDGLEEAIRLVETVRANGKKVIMVGNGGSAAIAGHQAVDYSKNGRTRAISFNESSLLTCIANDYGYQSVFEKPIEMFADAGDLVIAISSSGKSENILRATVAAKKKECTVITFSGFTSDNPLRTSGHLNFYVPCPSGAYGFAEIAHLSLVHCILESMIERNGIKPF